VVGVGEEGEDEAYLSSNFFYLGRVGMMP